MTSPLQSQVLGAINSVRPYLYGADFKVQILKINGTNRQYDLLVELTTDFNVSFDRSGNLGFILVSDAYSAKMRETTHLVFNGWLYQFTEPAKSEQGPFPMWRATGRPLDSRWIPEP